MPDLVGEYSDALGYYFYRMQLETGKAGENKPCILSRDEARLPEELLKLVAEKKEASFKMTYADSGYLYLCWATESRTAAATVLQWTICMQAER